MPFKSEAQRRKFGELVSQGKMSQDTFNEWNQDTPTSIPEKVGPQPKAPKTPKAPKINSFEDIRKIRKQKGY